jgi:hypothetical protein
MTVTSDYQFDINGFTFGMGATPAGLASSSHVSLTEVTGLDTPDVYSNVSPRAAAHGAYVTARFLKERVITMTGRLDTDPTNYASDWYQLRKAFLPVQAATPLTFKLPGYSNQFIYCFPHGARGSMRNVETAVGMVDFIATLVAADPRIYSTSLTTLTLTPAAAAGGVAFPITFPVTFSTSTTVTGSAPNNGTFGAPITITFYGPLDSPVVTDTVTGNRVSLDYSISTGDTVIVDTLSRTVTLNGSGSIYSALSTDSVFMEIPAETTSNFELVNNGGTGYAEISFRDTWI